MPRGPFPLTFPAAKALQTRGSCPGDWWMGKGRTVAQLALLVEEMFSFGSNIGVETGLVFFFFLSWREQEEEEDSS